MDTDVLILQRFATPEMVDISIIQYSSTPQVKIEKNLRQLGLETLTTFVMFVDPYTVHVYECAYKIPPACSIILLHNLYRS